MSKAKKPRNPSVSTKIKVLIEMKYLCLKIRSVCEARSAQFQRKDKERTTDVQTVRYLGALPQLMSMNVASRDAKFRTLPTSINEMAAERRE